MKVYILEDEPNILRYLITLVEKLPFAQTVGYSSNIATARQEIPALSPDLVLSDIQLSDGNSLTLFSEIETEHLQLIFITAYSQFAIEALNLGAFAYLLKPIEETFFNQTLLRCYQKKEQFKVAASQLQLALQYIADKNQISRISLSTAEGIDVVPIEKIVYLQSDKGYTTFYLDDGKKILVSKVIKVYEGLLPSSQFIRSHQSYLVNARYVRKYYKEGVLELTTSERIPVAERRREQVQKWLMRDGN